MFIEPYEINQLVVSDAFMSLFVKNGRPMLGRLEIEARFEASEDMANHVAEFCRLQAANGMTEGDVLSRCYDGLVAAPATTTASEAIWVTERVAELLSWQAPPWRHEVG